MSAQAGIFVEGSAHHVFLEYDVADEVDPAALRAALREVATVALEEHGFTYLDSRDLGGFIDGSANPKDDDRMAAALIPEGAAGAGGSFVLTQRWVHDLAKFGRLSVAEQEQVIGRTKADSVELVGDAMPATSHVSRTDLRHEGTALKIYRRSAPYGTVREHGLYFLAFACDPFRHEQQLRSMFGATGDGQHDRLTEFSRPSTGSLFFAPDAAALDQVLGAAG